MAKEKRSDIFKKKTKRYSKNIHKRNNIRKRRKKKRRFNLISLIIFLIFSIFIFEKVYNSPQRSIKKAILSIKEQDIENEKKYFDRIDKINEILSNSYSNNDKEKKEFLLANYKNLDVNIKDIRKNKEGFKVLVEVKNVCYIDIFDKLKDDKNIHSSFIKSLNSADKNLNKNTAELILEKKLTYYKIDESKEFVDAILGGVLKYLDEDGLYKSS